jgi:ribosomal protein S4
MREWAGWNIELTYEDAWNQELARKIYGRPRRAMRWTRSARGALEETIERSLSRLGISQDAYRIAVRFIEHDFIGALYNLEHRRREKRRKLSV